MTGRTDREELLTDISDRITRATRDGDPSGLLDPACAEGIDRLRALAVGVGPDTWFEVDVEALHRAAWACFLRVGALTSVPGVPEGTALEQHALGLGLAVHLHRMPGWAPPLYGVLLDAVLDPESAGADAARLRDLYDQLTGRLFTIWQATGAVDALVGVIALWEGALEHAEPGPRRVSCLTGLGTVLHAAAQLTGSAEMVDEAAHTLREAVAGADPDDGNLGIALNNLGQVHVTRADFHPEGTGLDDAITVFRRAADAAQPGSHDRALRLSNLGAVLLLRAERVGTADVRAAVDARRAAVSEAPPDDPLRPEWLTGLAAALHALGESGDDSAAGESLDLQETILAADPDRPDGPPLVRGVAVLAARLAGRTGTPADVDRAIRLLRAALRGASDGSEGLRDLRISLAEMLCRRHQGHSPDPQSLDEAITLLRATTPDPSPDRLDSSRIILGQALYLRFLDDDDALAVDEAVGLLTAALPVDVHPDEPPGPRLTLVHALRARHALTRDPADLDRAVAQCRVAVRTAAARAVPGRPDLLPAFLLATMLISRNAGWSDWDGPPDPDGPMLSFPAPPRQSANPGPLYEALDVLRPTPGPGEDGSRLVLVTLAADLLCRHYDRTGDRAALAAAVTALERELPADGSVPGPSLRSALADALKRRYERGGDPADFDRARALLQETVDRQPSGSTDPDDIHARIHLGNILMSRGIVAGDLTASGKAITLLRAALDELPDDAEPMVRAWCADSLGNALLERHERADDDHALDEALRAYRIAVQHTADPRSRPARLSNLGNALTRLYERAGDMDALREGVQHMREAVQLTADGHWDGAPQRHNLGGALSWLARQTHDPECMEEAVTVLREGAELAPDDSTVKAMILSTLASALRVRADLGGGLESLAEAVEVHERAGEAMAAADHPDQHVQHVNATVARVEYALRTADPAALDEAIGQFRELVDHAPGTSVRATVQFALGEALVRRLEYRDSAADREEALRRYRAAFDTPSGAPDDRARAAVRAGRLALESGDVPAAGTDFAHAVGLLDAVAWRGLARPDRERLLAQFGGVAGDAAACAIAQGRPDRALELLEQGRGVLLAQTLDAGSSLDVLRSTQAPLADAYAWVTRELERPLDTGTAIKTGTGDGRGPGHRTRAELARRREEILKEIRALPDQEGFLRPPSLPELLTAGRDGPVVLVNVSDLRCDALVVTADAVTPVPLPDLTRSAVDHRSDLFLQAVRTASDPRSDDQLLAVADREILGTLAWLWTAVAEPVLKATGFTDLPAGAPQPRLWWCPTGRLTLLPLHVAGPYGQDGPGTGVLDFAVSSYTPTLRALVHSRRARTGRPRAGGAPLVVALPVTPAARPLAGARRELDQLRRLRPQGRFLVGPDAVVERVLEQLAAHPWVHFACHGEQDRGSPGEGALRLYDGPLPLRRIARLGLADADLAYASACSTSGGGSRLADECLTVANALVLAGYRHVVGTLWEMTDASGPRIAAAVYDDLTSGGADALDSDRCPYALHTAVRELRRRRPAHPAAWAAHVHVGA